MRKSKQLGRPGWPKWQVGFLVASFQQLEVAEIAVALKRTKNAVWCKANSLGLHPERGEDTRYERLVAKRKRSIRPLSAGKGAPWAAFAPRKIKTPKVPKTPVIEYAHEFMERKRVERMFELQERVLYLRAIAERVGRRAA